MEPYKSIPILCISFKLFLAIIVILQERCIVISGWSSWTCKIYSTSILQSLKKIKFYNLAGGNYCYLRLAYYPSVAADKLQIAISPNWYMEKESFDALAFYLFIGTGYLRHLLQLFSGVHRLSARSFPQVHFGDSRGN